MRDLPLPSAARLLRWSLIGLLFALLSLIAVFVPPLLLFVLPLLTFVLLLAATRCEQVPLVGLTRSSARLRAAPRGPPLC